jgi:lysophospholipase L1-like esterase
MKKINVKEIILIALVVCFAISTIVLSVLLCVQHRKIKELEAPVDASNMAMYYKRKCELFDLENVHLSHGQIVFIGDSLTDGCALDTYYAGLDLAVYNRGIGGDSTSGVLQRLKVSLFDINPSKVVLLIGVNDINGHVNKEKILGNYSKILQEISVNLPTTEVVCVSLLPVNESLKNLINVDIVQSNRIIMELNPKIEELATQFNYLFVNAHPYFIDSNNLLKSELTVDGIHLNGLGYTVLSEKIKDVLE